jgi:hypothetical protein
MTGQRGTSVVELLVTLGLVSVVILAAAQLIGEAIRVAHGTRVATPSADEAALAALLRRDVQGAAGSVLQPTSWGQQPLEMVTWAGGRVRYAVEDESLVRETFAVTGAVSSRRVIARGVESWWWRLVTPRAVEVRVSLLPGAGRASSAANAGRRTVRRMFTFRGWPDGRSW